MGLISITNPAAGESIDAADVATPFNTLKNEFNGNIDNDNISSSAAIALSKLAAVAWTTFTPTWTAVSVNPTLGNGVISGRYMTIGKTCHYSIALTLGNSTNRGTGNWLFSVPLAAANGLVTYQHHHGVAYDTSASAEFPLNGRVVAGGSTVIVTCYHTNTGYTDQFGLSSSTPFSFADPDQVHISGTYEIV